MAFTGRGTPTTTTGAAIASTPLVWLHLRRWRAWSFSFKGGIIWEAAQLILSPMGSQPGVLRLLGPMDRIPWTDREEDREVYKFR